MNTKIPAGTLEICTVNFCTNFCDYCSQKTLIQAQKQLGYPISKQIEYMSFETYKKCVDKVPTDVWIDFSGFVEPCLNPKVGDFIVYAHEKGHKIRLFTTGEGMTREIINQIRDIPFVCLSWHVPDKFNILKATVNNEYCDTMSYMCRSIDAQIFAHCFGEIHDLIANQIDTFRWQGNPLFIERKKLSNDHLITRASTTIDTKLVQLTKPTRKKGKIICQPIHHKGGNRADHNVLLYNGLVVLCCCGYSLNHKLGYLNDDSTSYEDLFSSEEHQRIMRGWEDETIDIDCRHCELALEEKDLLLDHNRR